LFHGIFQLTMEHNNDFLRQKVPDLFTGRLIASIYLRDSIARRIKNQANVSALLHLEDARYGVVDSFDDDDELLQKACPLDRIWGWPGQVANEDICSSAPRKEVQKMKERIEIYIFRFLHWRIKVKEEKGVKKNEINEKVLIFI